MKRRTPVFFLLATLSISLVAVQRASSFERPGDIFLPPGGGVKELPPEVTFRRGDTRADGNVQLSDAVTLLQHLFFGSPATLACADAADADDNGVLTIGDASTILGFLFTSGRPLPAPFSACGGDPTGDSLGCQSFAGCTSAPPPPPSDAQIRLDLAYHYAPVHYQDASDAGYTYDMISRIDFNGNWDMASKWEATAGMGSPLAHVYYSVVSTATHWYIIYAFYHPRDWTNESFDDEHENDMEGMLLAVYRDGTAHGKLEAAVTAAHTDFYSYTSALTHFSGNAETIDGSLNVIDGSHPLTFQEAKGHGFYAYGGSHVEDGDGFWYYPSLPYQGNENATRPALPTSHGGDANPKAYYKLIDIFEAGGLWDRRGDVATFDRFGFFRGNSGGGCGNGATVTCSDNAANSPWGWDDGDDGPVFAGEMTFDPAHLVGRYFRTSTAFSPYYEHNPYAIEIELEELMVLSNQDPSGDRSDPYFRFHFGDGRGSDSHDGYEDGIIDGDSGAQLSWVLQNPPMSTWINLASAMPRNRFYTIKTVGSTTIPTFRISVLDWDGNSGDEYLMSPENHYHEYRTDGVFTYDFGRSQLKVRLTEAPGGR